MIARHWRGWTRRRDTAGYQVLDKTVGLRAIKGYREGCVLSRGLYAAPVVRERADDRPGVTMAFRYLGPVRPDFDESERPITIEWELSTRCRLTCYASGGSRHEADAGD